MCCAMQSGVSLGEKKHQTLFFFVVPYSNCNLIDVMMSSSSQKYSSRISKINTNAFNEQKETIMKQKTVKKHITHLIAMMSHLVLAQTLHTRRTVNI